MNIGGHWWLAGQSMNEEYGSHIDYVMWGSAFRFRVASMKDLDGRGIRHSTLNLIPSILDLPPLGLRTSAPVPDLKLPKRTLLCNCMFKRLITSLQGSILLSGS